MDPRKQRRQRGGALLMCALALFVLVVMFGLVADAGLLTHAQTQLESYAQEVARAGVSGATELNQYTNATALPLLNQRLATQQAVQFFQGLNLGPTYTLRVVAVSLTQLTVRLWHQQAVYFLAFARAVTLQATASAVPQAGI